MKPWHGKLCEAWFAAGSSARIEDVATLVGKTPAACRLALQSEECRTTLEAYHAAVRQHLVARRVAPLAKLAAYGEEAVDGLVEALRLAKERENIRELRECSVAILAHLGMGPTKRVEQVTRPDQITDPDLLRKILAADKPSAVLLEHSSA